MFDWKTLLYAAPAALISLSIHEFSHALIAYKLGDPTAKSEGRLTLNPLRHIDLLGLLAMVIAHFGWAKPVPVNPMYFRNPRKGMMLTAIAGPISNLIVCILFSLLYFFSVVFGWPVLLQTFFSYMTWLNIALAVFNLVPISPLDGSRVVGYYFPQYAAFMARHGEIVRLIFMALLILPNFLPMIPDILGSVLYAVESSVAQWLLRLWSTIFRFLL